MVKVILIKKDDRIGAMLLCFDYLNRFGDTVYHDLQAFNTGYDLDVLPQNMSFSPGVALFSDVILWAINNDFDRFNFLRGGEPYKYTFGPKDTKLCYSRVNITS